MIITHYKILSQYIIRAEHENDDELKKIQEAFSNLNNNQVNRNMVSNMSIRRDELDRPLRRPTTPMTNLSSTSNSQIFTNDRKSITSKMKPNIPKSPLNNVEHHPSQFQQNQFNSENVRHEFQENLNYPPEENKEEEPEIAFVKKDKLNRTPPTNTLN
jgi:hypothetical protein